MKLAKEELLEVQGGAISAAIVTALLKGVGIIVDLGRNLGSAIRRLTSKNVCPISN